MTDNFGWKADDDLDGLPQLATNNGYKGVAKHNGIFWISAFASRTLAAYQQQDGSRLPTRDISLHSDNVEPTYLWTDGQTIWVSDPIRDKLYAYRLSDGNRQETKDITPHADNRQSTGIWSDGTTIWVADNGEDKLYAYALDGGARQESREFDLHSSNDFPTGVWSDGYTIWVGDEIDGKLYAYFLETGQRRGRLDFNTPSGAGNESIAGITSEEATMWVLDDVDVKVYSYNLLLSDDRTLSALTVRPKDIIGFDAERDFYQLGVDSTVTRATVAATANHPGARVTFIPPDASSGTPGHQVDLSAGRNQVTVTVTAEDGSTRDNRVSINRGVTDTYGWNAGQDLDGLIAAENQSPYGIWGNDATFWVSDDTDDKLYAYNADGSRDASQDFDTLIAVDNRNPRGIWSNGNTMWVADNSARKLFAYRMSDKQPDSTKDFNTLNAAGNINPQGIWSNGTTMWVSDLNTRRIYAYRMSDQQRDDTKDFNSLAAANGDPLGISSDGTTMWVGDPGAGKLYAYDMASRAHVDTRDFNTLSGAGNGNLTAIWTDGETMWVVDYDDNKVYAYNMGLPPPANLQPAIGDRRITITWDNPQESAITGYQHRVSNDDGNSWNPDWTTIPGSNARTTSHTVRGLTNNVEHIIELRVLEGANPSGAARFRATPLGPPSVPLMPENLDTVAGDQTLYLSWHKPVEDSRAPVTSFDARYRPYGSSRSWRNATSVSVEQTAGIVYDQLIEGLDNRRTYEVQVAAVNSVGRGPWATASAVPQTQYRSGPLSDDGNPTLDLGPLNASWTDRLNSVTFHPDQKPLNINVIENSCMARTTFRIFWDVQGKAAKEYEADIQTREGAGEFTHQFGTETVEGRTQTYIYGTASLHKSSTLSVRVRARFDPEGWSTWSEPVDLFCFVTDSPATSLQLAEGDNNPATGRPAIAGTARVGETLSATTSDIADPDGLTSATFSYQWNRGDGSTNTDISDATAATYTLREEDLDHQGSVTVAFTDDEGNDETITSAPVLVQAATPLSGAFDSATLPGEHDGSSTFSFEIYFSEEPVLGFEDVRDHVLDVTNGDVTSVRRTTPGSNLRWEITVQPDGDAAVTMLLPVTANCDDDGAVCTGSEKKLLIGAAVFVRGPAASQEQAVANTAATGTPAITGTARVGETLTADTSGIADADGLQNATFSHQWVSSDGATDSDTPGETGATYVVQPGDVGKTIKVRVTFTYDAGNEETLTSAATAAVAATFPGTPRSLQVQTGGTGELAVTWQKPESNGGSDVTGYRVQWKLATGSWDTEADVSSATTTGISYTITSLALDTEYAVRVIAVSGVGDGPPSAERTETARARTSEQQDSTPNTAATGAPTISGKAQAGETLSARTSDISDADGLANVSFTYQWVSYDGNADTDIPGATGSTYTLVPADEGRAFRVRVSFTDDDGHRESLTSALARSERPYALSASASDGAVALTWKLPVGWPYSSTFQILRNRPELGETEPMVLVKYLQAPGNAHTDTDVAAGVLYVYRVKGVDPFGYPLEASQPVEIRAEAAAQADNNPASGAPTISGTVQVGETLTADTSGIADEDGLDNAAFSYQWLADDTAISGAAGATYTLAAADEGKVIKVRVSFTDDNSNDESLTSAATAAVAAAPPTNNEATGAPAISGTVKVGHVLTADITGIADQDGLDNADFDYQWLAEDSPIPGATGSAYLLVAADKGRAITVKVSFTDDGDSDESLTSAATAAVTTSPLTVGLENEPADHDGQNTFTFQLRFSEEFQVSYLTLRDDAFTVDGGEVTRARRLERDSITPNVRWEITVRPDGDVTITLPETTDCDAAGAICTEDDRMLSNRLEFTVSGLGQ